jgi:hypothetical protein
MKKIQLTIPEPCHENWDKMTQQDKGRFCAACQKTVVDFTDMSDREIAWFFKKPVSSVCGRFHEDQLNRNIDVPRKRIPWVKYLFQISIPALLMSAKASAQGKVVVRDTVCVKPSQSPTKNLVKEVDEKEITGVVRDENGNPIPGATINVIETKQAVIAKAHGEFNIKVKLNQTLRISSVAYESTLITIKNFSALNVTLKVTYTGKAVAVVSGYVVQKPNPSKKKNIPLIKKITDTAFKNYSVFPNPTSDHSYLKIDCSKLENAEYVLSVIDMSGEVLQTQEIIVDDKKKQIEFYLEEAKAGTYIIHLFNRKSTASFSEKIIVQ